jgi:hypothetical protein
MNENEYSYNNFISYINNYRKSFTNSPQRDMSGEEDAPGFSYEESRLLKAHLTSEFTKYLNNLKIGERPKPYFYDMMQGVIGYATDILYYSAAPFISKIIIDDLESGKLPFELLLCDKFFREFWLENKHQSHDFNAFTSEKQPLADPGEINKELYDNLNIRHHIPLEGDYKIISFNSLLYQEVSKVLKDKQYNLSQSELSAKNRFISYLKYILNLCHSKIYHDTSDNEKINLFQGLKTIYILYFKGGNSIREISERYNLLSSQYLKIDNLDAIIPYGSDFDTNILINPYFPLEVFNKIQTVLEVFIPQFTSLIVIPDSLKQKLIRPTNEDTHGIFLGNKPIKTEQEHQMNIMINSYTLNKMYLLAERIPRVSEQIDRLNLEPLFNLAPEKFSVTPVQSPQIKRSVIIECPNVFSVNDCKLSTFKISTSDQFPSDNSPGNPFNSYMTKLDKDYCYNSLQYQLNATIPKFRLHRLFLKFALGKKIQKTNHKPRLINIHTKHYNAEVLDISIVQPYYTITTDKTQLSCELLELWNNAPDIFKIAVPDTYKLYSFMSARFKKIGKPKSEKSFFPVFINGLNMQIDDLIEAIKDTLIEKKYEKINKRMVRLRLLRYLQIISPTYSSGIDTWNQMTVFNRIINLPFKLPPPFEKINESDPNAKYYRLLVEFTESHLKSSFYGMLEQGLQKPLIYKKNNDLIIPYNIFEEMALYSAREITKGAVPKDASELVNKITQYASNILNAVLEFKIDNSATNILKVDKLQGEVSILEGLSLNKLIYYEKLIIYYSSDKFNELFSILFKNEKNEYRIPYIFIHIFVNSINKLSDEHKVILDNIMTADIKYFLNNISKGISKFNIESYKNPYIKQHDFVEYDIGNYTETEIRPDISFIEKNYNIAWKYCEIMAGVSILFKRTFINFIPLVSPYLKNLPGANLDNIYFMMVEQINIGLFTNPFFADLLKGIHTLFAFFEGMPLELDASAFGATIAPPNPMTFLQHFRMVRMSSISTIELCQKFFTRDVVIRFLSPIDPVGLVLEIKDYLGSEYHLDMYSIFGSEYYFSTNVSKFDSSPYAVIYKKNTSDPKVIGDIQLFLPELSGIDSTRYPFTRVSLFSFIYPSHFTWNIPSVKSIIPTLINELPEKIIGSVPKIDNIIFKQVSSSIKIIDLFLYNTETKANYSEKLYITTLNTLHRNSNSTLLYMIFNGILYILHDSYCLGFSMPYTNYIFKNITFCFIPIGSSITPVINIAPRTPEFIIESKNGKFIVNGIEFYIKQGGGLTRNKTRKGRPRKRNTIKKTRVYRKVR